MYQFFQWSKRINLKADNWRHISQLEWLLLGLALIMLSATSLSYTCIMAQSDSKSNVTSLFSTYNNPNYPFSIQYPQNWKIEGDPEGVWFISPVDGSGNLRIETQVNQNKTLDNIIESQINKSKLEFQSYEVLSRNSTTLASGPAEEVFYKFKAQIPGFLNTDTFELKGMQIFSLRGSYVYIVTYFSNLDRFEIFLPTVQKAISSLKITT
jgi:PsbP-like protein